MQVCEEALKNMKNSKRRIIKGTLHISGDGLRVSDTETKGLVLDQTIEKVSFCAPDRNYDKGFSYICRDGTTRRWLCHGFMAVKDTGERLSHAVGCAFAICLEKKQRRDKECSVQMSYDHQQNTFTRFGSFRQGTISERLQDPQNFKPLDSETSARPPAAREPVSNPSAVARPKASDLMYLRQASFRGFGGQLSANSPFKRQFSLRLNELPSTLARQARDSATANGHEQTQFSPIEEDAGDTAADILSPEPGPLTSLSPVTPASILQPTRCSSSRSPLTSSRSPVLETVPEASSPDLQSPSSNPWDNVPDQPLSRPGNLATTSATRPTSCTDTSLPLDAWLSGHQLSNLTLLQPERSSKPPSLVSTKSHSFDHASSTSMLHSSNPHQSDQKSQLPFQPQPSQNVSNNDPFDADWVNLAMRNKSQVKKSTNPFLQDSIKTFELKM